jgi:filamentous hemagglutinin family protein
MKMSRRLLTTVTALALAAGAAQAGPAANALPTNGQVAAGSAVITQSGSAMSIRQSTQRAVINWGSFDVGSKARVDFVQPNTSAATLNRVNSASASMIEGAVNANGQVVFVNPNGVVFGQGAEVNTGAIVATTMNVSDADFMAGGDKLKFQGGATGQVINKGKIKVTSLNGYIALMAPQVVNEGVLVATMSGANAIALVAGQAITLTFGAGQLLSAMWTPRSSTH